MTSTSVLWAQALAPSAAIAAPQTNAPADCAARLAEDFVPMTPTERIVQAEFSVGSATPFLYSAVRAGIDQAYNRPKEWRQGAEGFGLRYGSIYGELFISQVFEQGVAYRLHEDNRYFGSGRRNPAARLGYALASTILARHEDGSRSVSVSAIGGAASAAFISRAWQPRSSTSVGDAAVSFGLTMAVRAGFNVLREFSPRVFGRMLP